MSTLPLFPGLGDARAHPQVSSSRLTRRPAVSPRKATLGQFMTPPHVAAFMASLFDLAPGRAAALLDAGAGQGCLTGAFMDRWSATNPMVGSAIEVDPEMRASLVPRLSGTTIDVVPEDFIGWAVRHVLLRNRPFTHAILNPPYRKLGNDTVHNGLIQSVGIDSPNLYAAFVALTLDLMQEGGQIVALIPRSFCNGAYYKAFRTRIIRKASIDRIHLVGSRTSTFKGDSVLQENVIVRLTRGRPQGNVDVSHSSTDLFDDISTETLPFAEVVPDPRGAAFIHIPTGTPGGLDALAGADQTLEALGLQVSTGPVVDFRVREHLRDDWEPGAAPLIYPLHFDGLEAEWPRQGARKPNALLLDAATRRSTYASGTYCVVRRLSSKEERRRVIACVVCSDALGHGGEPIAFENHVNVFHIGRGGLLPDVARGLSLYLSSTAFDISFRSFNGHTQVNVGDLKQMPYPALERLERLGRSGPAGRHPSQEAIDAAVLQIVR